MRGLPDGLIGVAQITRCVTENSAAFDHKRTAWPIMSIFDVPPTIEIEASDGDAERLVLIDVNFLPYVRQLWSLSKMLVASKVCFRSL